MTEQPFYASSGSFEKMVMADMALGVMMRINLQWKDSRLQYNNIRMDQFQNDVEPEKQSNLWLPVVSFSTAKTGKITSEADSDRLAVLKESGEKLCLKMNLVPARPTWL
jgi:hypothetical protein